MTPATMKCMLDCYTTPNRGYNFTASTIDALIEEDLIALDASGDYIATSRGAVFVNLLCATPLPVQKWIDPRTLEEGQ